MKGCSDSREATCRACLQPRRSLRSVYQQIGAYTYAEIFYLLANVKVDENDGLTNKICSICRGKAEEAIEFKTLLMQSDSILQEKINSTPHKKFTFSNISDIKVEIGLIKTENGFIGQNIKEIKLDLNLNDEEITYKNVSIKKLVKLEPREITFEEFVEESEIKYEVVSPDENHFYDDLMDNDDEYLTKALKNVNRKGSKKNKQKKKEKDQEYNPYASKSIPKKPPKKRGRPCKYEYEDISQGKATERVENVQIVPEYLYDIRSVPNPPPKRKKTAKSSEEQRSNHERICPYCGKITKHIKMHLLTHIGERKFKCTQCPKSYLTEKALIDHAVVHGEKKFECDTCKRKFYKIGLLKNHITSHSIDRNYICEICTKAFKRKNTLRRHTIRHSSANKTVKCDLCNMSFFEQLGLRHHMRIHTGERPYRCDICSQPYSYKHDYDRHCFKKHGIYVKKRQVHTMTNEVLEQERVAVKALLENQPDIVFPTNIYDTPCIIDAMQINRLFNTG